MIKLIKTLIRIFKHPTNQIASTKLIITNNINFSNLAEINRFWQLKLLIICVFGGIWRWNSRLVWRSASAVPWIEWEKCVFFGFGCVAVGFCAVGAAIRVRGAGVCFMTAWVIVAAMVSGRSHLSGPVGGRHRPRTCVRRIPCFVKTDQYGTAGSDRPKPAKKPFWKASLRFWLVLVRFTSDRCH